MALMLSRPRWNRFVDLVISALSILEMSASTSTMISSSGRSLVCSSLSSETAFKCPSFEDSSSDQLLNAGMPHMDIPSKDGRKIGSEGASRIDFKTPSILRSRTSVPCMSSTLLLHAALHSK